MPRPLTRALLALAALAPAPAALADLRLSTDEKVDNTAAIQAALDRVPERQNLLLPAGRFRADGPIFLGRRHVGIVGHEAGTTLFSRANRPMLAVGFDAGFAREAWVPVPLDDSVPRPALGIDLSKAGVLLTGTPLEHGPPAGGGQNAPGFWKGVRRFSVRMILVPTAGVGDSSYQPLNLTPLIAWMDSDGTLVWGVRTVGGDSLWKVPLPKVAPNKPLRLAFLVDLDEAKVEAFVDGKPVEPKPRSISKDWKPGPKLELRAELPVDAHLGRPFDPTATRVIFAGMRLSAGLERPTPATRDEWYVAAGRDKNVIAVTPPKAPLPYVPVTYVYSGAAGQCAGMIVPANYATQPRFTLRGTTLERIRFELRVGYGAGVLLGSVGSFRADRLDFSGGASGLAQVRSAASYPLVVERCRAQMAAYAAFRLGFSINRLRDIEIGSTGRHALTFTSGGDVADLFVGEGGATTDVIRCFGSTEGTRLVLRDAVINYEAFQAERIIHVTQGECWATIGPHVILDDVICNNSKLTPILLDGSSGGPPWRHGTLELHHFGAGTFGNRELVEVRGAPWEMEIVGVEVPGVTHLPRPKAKAKEEAESEGEAGPKGEAEGAKPGDSPAPK
jgi:hypothetical protein